MTDRDRDERARLMERAISVMLWLFGAAAVAFLVYAFLRQSMP